MRRQRFDCSGIAKRPPGKLDTLKGARASPARSSSRESQAARRRAGIWSWQQPSGADRCLREPRISSANRGRHLQRADSHRAFQVREDSEQALLDGRTEHRAELVCLAGFMRILSPGFLRMFRGQILNIHPSLLPAFPGLHAPKQALIHGVKITGCTVHFVDEATDNGPILVQAAVPVLPGDTEESLAARIQVEEHRIYPMAVRWVATQLVVREDRRTRVYAKPAIFGLSLLNPGS